MNFAVLLELFARRGNDRNAIAEALGMSVEQIDRAQREARLAAMLTDDERAQVDGLVEQLKDAIEIEHARDEMLD